MFLWWTTHPVVLKSIVKVPNQKVTRMLKCFSFFFFFRRASSISLWLFHNGFLHKMAAFFTKQCTSPSLFSRFEVTRGDSNCSLKNYGFLYDSSVHNSTLHLFDVERYVGWGCILNCFMLSSLPCFYAFADLLSLHLVTFLMFLFLLLNVAWDGFQQKKLHYNFMWKFTSCL